MISKSFSRLNLSVSLPSFKCRMTSPSWLTVEYFQAILAKNLKNTSVKVLSIEFEPCGVTGGFLSTLLRVQVKYFMHSVEVCESFVVKLETTQGAVLEKVGKVGYDVQNKEMKFFEEVGPLMKKTLRKIGEHANFIPKVLKVDHENHVLIFEDLKSKNFDMVDCMNGLNENETKLALSKLAKFHAASLVINQKHSNLLGSFDIGMFSRKRNEFNFAFSSIFEIAAEEIATWEGFEHYGEKLQQLKGSFIENTTKCFDIQPGDFCVLNHGDIWTNNVMFKFDENGNAEDSILVRPYIALWCGTYFFASRSTSNSVSGCLLPSISFIFFTRRLMTSFSTKVESTPLSSFTTTSCERF